MRRVSRHLPTVCSAACVLLCIGFTTIWFRSFGYYDQLLYAGGDARVDFSVTSDRGIVMLDVWSTSNHMREPRWNLDTYPSDDGWRFSYPPGFRHGEEAPVDGGFNRAGFMFSPQSESGAVPHWSLVVLTAVPPFARVLRRVRNVRRPGRGVCRTCGYDLRATPDRCPECGSFR